MAGHPGGEREKQCANTRTVYLQNVRDPPKFNGSFHAAGISYGSGHRKTISPLIRRGHIGRCRRGQHRQIEKTLRLTALASALYEDLLHREGVSRLVLARRAVAIFSSGTPATSVYFLDSGLVKVEKLTESGKEILLGIVAPGEIFGEQALLGEGAFSVSAKVLEAGVAYSIPAEMFQRFCERRPEVWRLLMQHFLLKKDELERKIEHLCMSDVKQRIVYYLDELARLNPGSDPGGTVIHISQNEL